MHHFSACTPFLVKKGIREVYSDEANLATGASSSKVKRRNEISSTISSDGKEVTVTGPNSSELKAKYGKHGLNEVTGNVQGQDFGSRVDQRDSFGAVEQVNLDPAGPGGSYDIALENGRMTNASGPGLNTNLGYDFTAEGVKVTASDTISGDVAVHGADAHGHVRDLTSTGRPPLQITGDALSGSFSVSVPGQSEQFVDFTTGPLMDITSKTRSDGSGTSFVYYANGELDTYTRNDGTANGGGSYTFDLKRDGDTRPVQDKSVPLRRRN